MMDPSWIMLVVKEKVSVREFRGTSLAVRLDVGGRLGPASRGLADPFTHSSLIYRSEHLPQYETEWLGGSRAGLGLVRGARTSRSPTKPTTTAAQFCDAKPNHQEEAQENRLNPEW
jgi:hypothetical protein